MKRLFLILSVLILSAALSISVCAAANTLLSDGADLLSNDEEIKLTELLYRQSTRTGMDIAVVTVYDYVGYDIESYTESFCDSGFLDDGILLMIAAETREYCLTKCGRAESAVSDYGLDSIEEAFLPYLSDGDYYIAFSVFAEMSASALSDYASDGEIYDGEDFVPDISVSTDGTVTVTEGKRPIYHYFVCLIIGIGLAFIPMLIMQSGMKTVRSQSRAGDYIVNGSLALEVSSDRFLYRTVTKTAKPQSSSSSGRGGFSGGSRSSSGRF